MVDLGLSVVITRASLGLPDLQLNDHETYYVSADQFMGAQSAWNRNQVSSPFIDGSVTISRQRTMVNEPLALEVIGDSPLEVQQAITALKQAFDQSDFNIGVQLGAATWTYQCEAADTTIARSTPRLVANQWQVVFSVPRQPNPITGGF
jgi:hypothetical protein